MGYFTVPPTPGLAGDLHNTTHTRGTYIRANSCSQEQFWVLALFSDSEPLVY